MEIGGGRTQVVYEFVGLGTCITTHRHELKDVNRRIGLANKAHLSLLPIMKLRGTYASQDRLIQYANNVCLVVQARHVLANTQWQNRYTEIYNLYREMELTRNVRLRRLQWVGQVLRIKDEMAPKKALNGYTEETRPVGRPTGRWS
jgi:hypothetical protein